MKQQCSGSGTWGITTHIGPLTVDFNTLFTMVAEVLVKLPIIGKMIILMTLIFVMESRRNLRDIAQTCGLTKPWIDLNKRNEQEPFFMYLALNAAHSPFNVPGVYAEMYEDAPLSKEQKRFYGMVSNIDNNFGRLVDYLKKNKLFDNTILIFATDNGTAKGISFSKNENKELGYNAGLRGIKGKSL